MKVYVDGQEYTGLPDNADPAFILNAVKSGASREGRVMMEIEIDGVAVEDEAFLNVTGGLRANFLTRPVRELVQ